MHWSYHIRTTIELVRVPVAERLCLGYANAETVEMGSVEYSTLGLPMSVIHKRVQEATERNMANWLKNRLPVGDTTS